MADPGPGGEQNRGCDGRDHHRRGEMRLQEYEKTHHAEHQKNRQESVAEGVETILLLDGYRRGPQDDRDLGEFRRLHRDAKVEPPPGAVDPGRDGLGSRQEQGDEQQHREGEEWPGKPPVQPVVHDAGHGQNHQSDSRPADLLEQVVAVLQPLRLGDIRACAVHREQTERDQRERHGQQSPSRH